MSAIYLRHPQHGEKVAVMEAEAAYDESNGWVRFDPHTKPEPEPAPRPSLTVSKLPAFTAHINDKASEVSGAEVVKRSPAPKKRPYTRRKKA